MAVSVPLHAGPAVHVLAEVALALGGVGLGVAVLVALFEWYHRRQV